MARRRRPGLSEPNLRTIVRWLDRYLEEGLVIALLIFLVCAVCIEVFRRYVLNDSGAYSEEIARFSLIWMVYLGLPYAIRMRRHIGCDLLPSKMPHALSVSITLIGLGCFLIFSLMMVYQTYKLVMAQIEMGKMTEAMQVPAAYFSSGIGIGFGLASFRLIQAMWRGIQAFRDPNAAAALARESESEVAMEEVAHGSPRKS